jgi:alpha-glucosidase (family GH31 glycosyl hydrolase)
MTQFVRRIIPILFCFITVVVNANEEWNPVAQEEAVVTSGNARFTILTPRLIRIQYSSTGKFEDRATFAVVNRRLPVPAYTCTTEGSYLIIRTDSLTLRYKVGNKIQKQFKNSNILSITFQMNGRQILWYPGKDDALNLLGTQRTLDGNIGDTHRVSLEKGLLSRGGWSILDESPSTQRGDGSRSFPFENKVDGIPWIGKPLDTNAIDWYFFGYGHQYKDALADYVRIAGRQPLPPKFMFGYWYSKYQAYKHTDIQQLLLDMESLDVPHDVLMIDCDWHQNSWTGWTWNKSLFPNPATLLNWMHTHNTRTALNLHPADGIGSSDENFSKIRNDMGLDASATTVPWQLEDSTFYRTFFKNLMRVREKQGVDFWWIDWQQDLTSSYIPGLGQTFWLNHVFYNDMKLNRTDRRPVIFHRWGGMGSHRYPIGFSGDTFATFGTLQFESYFTATAANVCFGYWGHDGGGYLQPNEVSTDPELVLRWMQFCVFQPIFRTHGSSQSSCERRVWKFHNFDLQRDAFQLRYTLVPYIYNAARQAYDTGVSICRPLYYEWPEENKAYTVEDEYLFGDDILVSPISTPVNSNDMSERKTWLPEGCWYDICRNRMLYGGRTIVDQYALSEIPYFIRQGSIIPCNPEVMHLKSEPSSLVLWVIPGDDGEGRLYEDQGDSEAYKSGEYATTRFTQTHSVDGTTLTIHPREGSFAGMAEERAWKVVFFSVGEPSSVCIDGNETSSWSYDEQTCRLTVDVPSRSCSEAIVIRMKEIETGLSSIVGNGLEMRYDSRSERLLVDSEQSDFVVTVHDLQGKQWIRLQHSSAEDFGISLSSLPKGEYICNCRAGSATVSRKILKP